MAEQYDGFISYSHAADDLLAPRLQAGLQRFAKPWWKRRALRVFRDESSLSANPHLWSSITEALDGSEWFVLLLSEDAAQSEWVNREVEYWVANKDPSRILPVVTDSEFAWENGDLSVSSTAAPPALSGVFTEEPRWVDLRWARTDTDLDLSNPRFSDAVADVAAAMRAMPKDELAGEEVRQHRRTIRTAWAAGVAVLLLGIAATVGAIVAMNESNQAKDAEALARARELAASSLAVIDGDPQLATLLALESMQVSDSDPPGFVVDTLWRAAEANHLERTVRIDADGATMIDVSADGSMLVAATTTGVVRLLDTVTGEGRWEKKLESTDVPWDVVFHPDGDVVAVSIADNDSFAWGEPGPNDDLLNRVLLLNTEDGTERRLLEYPECLSAGAVGWTPDGELFAVYSAWEPCPRDDGSAAWIEVLDAETFELRTLIELPEAFGAIVTNLEFTDAGDLVAFGFQGSEVLVFSGPDYATNQSLAGVDSVGGPSPDGETVATYSNSRSAEMALFDAASGARFDVLELSAFPSLIDPVTFSADGSLVAIPSEGRDAIVVDVASGKTLLELPGGPATSLRFSPDQRRAYTGHTDGTVKFWDLQAQTLGQTVVESLAPGEVVNARFVVGPDLGAAAIVDLSAAEQRSKVVLFDLVDGTIVSEHPGGYLPQALQDGRFVFRVDGRVVVHDPRSGNDVEIAGCASSSDVGFGIGLDEPWRTVGEASCDATGETAANIVPIASIDRTELMLWDVDSSEWTIVDPDTGSLREQGPYPLPGDQPQIRFASDWIFARPNFESGVALDRATGAEIATFDGRFFYADVSSERRLLAGADVGTATFINWDTWTSWEVSGDFGDVRAVAFSPSGQSLAVGDERSIVIIDVEERRQIRSLPVGTAAGLYWLDEQTMLVGTRNPSRWITVSLDSEALEEDAATGLTRGFSSLECETYIISPCPTLDEIRARIDG